MLSAIVRIRFLSPLSYHILSFSTILIEFLIPFNRKPIIKPILTEFHKGNRYLFALMMLERDAASYRYFIFLDEKTFQSCCNGPVRCWRRDGERLDEDCVHENDRSGRFSVNFLLAFGNESRGILLPVDRGFLTRARFLMILEEEIVPAAYVIYGLDIRNCELIMDNCPSHHGNAVEDAIENGGFTATYMPPKSPDLNPVENAWAEISRRLPARRAANRQDLINMVMEAYASIPNEYFSNLLSPAAIRRRFRCVLQSGGSHVKY